MSVNGHVRPLHRFLFRRLPGSFGVKDDSGFSLGNLTTALPTCAESARGIKYRIDGAAGTQDREVVCRKNAANVYEWGDVPTTTTRGVIPVFNARDYGAVGDGTTDDYAAINAAVLAAGAAGGGIVYFPAGAYRVGTSITAQGFDSIHFRGAGRGLTTIKPTDANPGTAQCFNILTNHCSIRDLTADGNRAFMGGSGLHAIRIQGVGHTIDNVRSVNSPGYGIGVGQGAGSTVQELTISNVVVEDSGADGIDFKNQSGTNRHNSLVNVTIGEFDANGDTGKAGIDCRGPVRLANISILCPLAIGASNAAVRFRPDSAGPLDGGQKSSLTNAVIIGPAASALPTGIQILNNDVAVSNVYVEGFGNGFLVSSPSTGASLTNCRARGAVGQGFNVHVAATLANCHATACTTGFDTLSSSADVALIGCSSRDCTTDGVHLNGSRAHLIGHKFLGTGTTALRIQGSSSSSLVAFCDFTAFTGAVLAGGVATDRWWMNAGRVTHNKGATSVADGGTISHGLVATPTRVSVTPSVAAEMASVTAVGATTFTVALKTGAGAAGTTQTVYWEAEV